MLPYTFYNRSTKHVWKNIGHYTSPIFSQRELIDYRLEGLSKTGKLFKLTAIVNENTEKEYYSSWWNPGATTASGLLKDIQNGQFPIKAHPRRDIARFIHSLPKEVIFSIKDSYHSFKADKPDRQASYEPSTTSKSFDHIKQRLAITDKSTIPIL